MNLQIPLKQIVLSVLCIMSSAAIAQNSTFNNAISFGSIGADEPYCSAIDASGNYYVVGKATGAIAAPYDLMAKGGSDAILVKYAPNLTLQWARYVGGAGNDTFEGVTVLSSGEIVVVGQLGVGTVTIDGSESTITTTATTGIVMQFSSDGLYKTHTTISCASNKAAIVYSVAKDKSDNIFITGSALGTTTFNNEKSISLTGTATNMFLAQYNSNLQCQWAIGGESKKDETFSTASYGWALTIDNSENILVTGRFGNNITLQSTDSNPISKSINNINSVNDQFIAKFSNQGVCQWITYLTNTKKRIDCRAIATDSKDNIFVFGHSDAAVTVEGQVAYNFAGNFDNFLVKFDKDGKYVDGFSNGGLGRDEAKGILIDKDDNIYMVGNINGGSAAAENVNMNPKANTPSNYVFRGHDGYFAKYNGVTLELLQVEKTNSPIGQYGQHEVAWCIQNNNKTNQLYVTGYFNNKATIFDNKNLSFPLVGGYDIYTILYDMNGDPTALNNNNINSKIVFYPTLSKGEVSLNVELETSQRVSIKVFTILGLPIWEKQYHTNNIQEILSTSTWGSGNYFVLVKIGTESYTERLIVQ